MSTTELDLWQVANQQGLLMAISQIRATLQAHVSGNETEDGVSSEPHERGRSSEAIGALCSCFGLTPFERDILLLCAGMEMDGEIAALCAAIHGDAQRGYPTFSLALAALPGAHWSAVTPGAPLRYWRLIDVGTGHALTQAPLRIDERVMHYLAGVQNIDERLAGVAEHVLPPDFLVPSHHRLAEIVARHWDHGSGMSAVVQLSGVETEAKRGIAAAACAALGMQLYSVPAEVIPSTPAEIDAFCRLWTREVVLHTCALLVDCEEMETGDAARAQALSTLLARLHGPILITSRDRLRIRHRRAITLDVGRPTRPEQRTLWHDQLGPSLNGQVETLVGQFDLAAQTIRNTSLEVAARAESSEDVAHLAWDSCLAQVRPRMEDLAQRIEPGATWNDLILPDSLHQVLLEIVAQVCHRVTVYETWGFERPGSRGLGISALFAGPSGTGKTTAAEVLARELRLDLYRIDLSSVVSKYIGETEKNLRRVFDAAEEGGAVLLFDEADALFGKRSEVKDSHDRYANIEVGYLLQRMESYRGLAILTTNMRKALDTAFLRRIRFVAQFPFPDAAQRAEIWRHVFPGKTPTEGLDPDRLAQLSVAGGSIKNIALYAAFLAADRNEPVRMTHMLRAAQREYAKLEKPLTETETRGWNGAEGVLTDVT